MHARDNVKELPSLSSSRQRIRGKLEALLEWRGEQMLLGWSTTGTRYLSLQMLSVTLHIGACINAWRLSTGDATKTGFHCKPSILNVRQSQTCACQGGGLACSASRGQRHLKATHHGGAMVALVFFCALCGAIADESRPGCDFFMRPACCFQCSYASRLQVIWHRIRYSLNLLHP